MKRVWLVAMAVALAPVAHAQDCTSLDSAVKAAAANDFEGMLGDEDKDEEQDGLYDTYLYITPGGDCVIDDYKGVFRCLWSAPTTAEADKAIAPLYDIAKVCLSEGWAWTELAGKPSADSLTIIEGYQMTKRSGANAGAVVQLYMEGKPAEAARQVWLRVSRG